LLPLNLVVKQRLLEMDDPHARLVQLREVIVNLHYL